MNAQLHIQAAVREGITYLDKTYFTPPFKVANITENKRSPWLHLMIMNSSPGILDGDHYEIRIDLNENALLHLHTQSYQRLFNMKNGATQLMEVHLKNNAEFIHLPHPAVPHERSIFTTRNRIFISGNCNLIWGEVITCGRKLSRGLLSENGEIFLFTKYHAVTEVFINNSIVIRENLLMQPRLLHPNSLGQLEGFTHQASLVCFNRSIKGKECQDEIHNYLSGQKDILSGISSTAADGMIVRILGFGAEQLHQHLQAIALLIMQQKIIEDHKFAYAS